MLATHPRLEPPPIPSITSQFLDDHPVELQQGIQSLEQDVSPRSRSIDVFLKNLEEIGMTSSSTSRPREEAPIRTEFELSQNFHKFTFSGDTETCFLLRSGYLIQVRKGEVPGWAYMDLSPKHDLQGYTPAPLEWKGVPRRFEGDEIMGWALDLDQDLVAASFIPYQDPFAFFRDPRVFHGYKEGKIEIHLVQFTDGTIHKSAKKAVVQLEPLEFYDTEFKTHIAIMGDYLVVLLARYIVPDGIVRTGKYQTRYLVNWVKGHVIEKSDFIEDTYFPVLTSISKNAFVMGRRDWALELCEIREKKDGTSYIRTHRMLELPAVQPDSHVILEKFDETPSVTGSPSAPGRPSTFPFRDPPRDSVLAFYVRASSRSGKKQALLFSVFTSTLRNFTATVGTTRKRWWQWRPHEGISTVPWNEWGPELTRWINVEDIPIIRAHSGTQCLIFERSTGRVRMLDFNPEEEWIKPRTGETVGRDWQMMTSPTTIPAGEIFQYDVESKLPYYEVTKAGLRVEAGFTFFMDDNCVVLISRPDVIDGSAVHSVLDSST